MPDPVSAKQFLDQHAAAFTERESVYQFLRDSYEGGRRYIDTNLFQHSPRETAADFTRRRQQAVYPNFVRPVLKTYRDHVFKRSEGVARSVDDDAYLEWSADVDRAGSDANLFWGRVGMREMLYGWMGVLVDMPSAPEIGREMTQADVGDLGMTPYLVAVPPSQIVDWSLDDWGNLNWVHLQSKRVIDEELFTTRRDETVHELWTRTEWYRVDERGNTLDEGTHGCGVVPFVIARFEDSEVHELIGTSFMEDFCMMGRALMNSLSLRADFLAKNSMQILAIQLSALSADDSGNTEEVIVRNLLEYPGSPGETVHPPQFIGPNTSGAEWMFRHVEDLREHMYFTAMLQSAEAKAGQADAESGISKIIDFEQTNSALASFADSLESAEIAATRLWFAWQGRDWDEAWEIDYPDTFNIQAVSSKLAEAIMVRDLYGDASPTLLARYLESLSGELVEDLEEQDVSTIASELDENLHNLTEEVVVRGRMAREQQMPTEETII